jgi:LmbE family N-acetylglucosaminyl deacetylase
MSTPGRALVILAHPDDAEFLAGGTVALWIAAGWEVVYLLCTDGSAGSDDPAMTPARLSALRQAEQAAAAEFMGVAAVAFLDHPDGQLQHTLDLRRELARFVRRYRPDRVLCFDPMTRYFPDYVNHPDHYISGEAALAAVFPAARERLAFPELLDEGLEPHKVMEIWLCGTLAPNHWQEISATIDRKIAAMCLHASQVGDPAAIAATLRRRAADEGSRATPPIALAESFRVITMRR